MAADLEQINSIQRRINDKSTAVTT